MLDGGDVEGMVDVVEAHPVVADPQPELGRFDGLQALHIAFAGRDKMGQGAQNAQGGWLVDGAELGFGLVLPDNLLAVHAYWPLG
jgi:hypothetical protein